MKIRAQDAHFTKLERWKLDQELRAENYKAPELPYLAWVPCDGVGGSLSFRGCLVNEEKRYLMCLLCRKSGRPEGTWVSEEPPDKQKSRVSGVFNYIQLRSTHTGTHEMPGGSKDRAPWLCKRLQTSRSIERTSRIILRIIPGAEKEIRCTAKDEVH